MSINGVDVSGYTHTELESSIGFSMYHTTNDTHINLVLSVDDTAVTWAGWGISETGHMKGSDIVTLEFSNGDVEIKDRHVPFSPITVSSSGERTYDMGKLYPHHDKSSDWVLGNVNGQGACMTADDSDTRVVVLSRLLDTGDSEDRAITDGEHPIVWAWGTSGAVSNHGANRGFISKFRFKGDAPVDPAFSNELPTDHDGTALFTANYAIPNDETTYVSHPWAMPIPNLDTTTAHIVAIEIYDLHSSVHHIVANKGSTPIFVFTQKELQNFVKCGFPVGGSGADDWDGLLNLQFHYDNPARTAGMVDTSSKMKVYYTSDTSKRLHDCGIMIVGDLQLVMDEVPSAETDLPYDLGPLPPNAAEIHRQSTCPSECTENLAQPLTIFAGGLHMHYYGQKITIDHYGASGDLIANRGRSDYWDNGHQLMDPTISFELKPSESLQMHCIFNTEIHSETVMFDEDTSNEMCQIFMYYYPAHKMDNLDRELSMCGMHVSSDKLHTLCGSQYLEPLSTQYQQGRNGTLNDPIPFSQLTASIAATGASTTCAPLAAGYGNIVDPFPSQDSQDGGADGGVHTPSSLAITAFAASVAAFHVMEDLSA